MRAGLGLRSGVRRRGREREIVFERSKVPMLKDEGWNGSSPSSHVQSDRAEPREAHEDQSVRFDTVEDVLSRAEIIPVVPRSSCVRALFLLFAEAEEVVEIELTVELLEGSNPSLSLVTPAQKDSWAINGQR